MKKIFVIAAALIVLGGCETTQKKTASNPQWYTYSSASGGYSVEMPGRPRLFNKTVSTSVGNLTFYFAMYKKNGNAFMASYNDYPELILRGIDLNKLLKNAKMGAARKIMGDVVFEKMISINGHPGIEFEVHSPQKQIKYFSRAYIVKNRLYQIVYVSGMQSASLKQKEYMFNSFRLK